MTPPAFLRRRPGRARWTAALVVSLALVPACGKKGPPLAPLIRVPARPDAVEGRRLGAVVFLQARVPDHNQDGSSPADIVRLEVFAYTGEPKSLADVFKYGTVVTTLPIRRPPDPAPPKKKEEGAAATSAPAPPPRPAAPGYDQGAMVVVSEALTPAAVRPVILPGSGRFVVAPKPLIPSPLLGPPPGDVPARIYIVVGYNHDGQRGTPSERVVVPIHGPPLPPAAPVLTYTADHFTLAWRPPATMRRPLQEAATGGVLPSVPLVESFPGAVYNVYEVERGKAAATAGGLEVTPAAATLPAPVNEKPLAVPTFDDSRFAFGAERCYVIRTVDTFGPGKAVESEPSPVACVTPRDTFPPAAPKGLQAVAGDGAVSLIWEPSAEPDLAGYLVLRGIAPGGTLERLTTEPIQETTYSDASARPGARYVYAIVAVDKTVPPNVSARSNLAEVLAR